MKKKKDSMFTIIIFVFIVIIGIMVYLLFNKENNRYKKIENQMVSVAKNYVVNNNISSDGEKYFDVLKLGISIDDDCSITSGVFYSNNNYQAYLSCSEYETSLYNTSNEFMTLIGKSVYVIAKGVGFFDPGYQSSDIIEVMGEVEDKEGVYTLYYAPKNSNVMLNRKVVVLDDPVIKELFPVISIYGEKEVYAIQGDKFLDEGVMATDTNNADLTSQVLVYSDVNVNVIGNYKVDYVITNSKGYTNSTSRMVSVISPNSDLEASYTINPTGLTGKNVTINFNVIGNDFSHVILPNGEERNTSNFNYVVVDNGTYKFTIYDDKGRSIERSVIINNIDKTKPEASCLATWRYNRTEIEVNISSMKSIKSYEYNIDNNVQVSNSNKYTSDLIKPNSIKVTVVDEIDNSETITCTIDNQSTPQIYIDDNDKRCLEGYTCYVQRDWGSSNYYYCADAAKKSCGTIAGHGCSIVSFATAISKFNTKSVTGVLHNPYTLLTEVYNGTGISHNGVCGGGCSGWSPMKSAALYLGLDVQDKYLPFNKSNVDTFKDYLRKGYSIVISVSKGPYSTGHHLIAVLGIRDDDYVYLYNTNAGSGTSSLVSGFKQNDWVPISDLLNGEVTGFLAFGPPKS